MAAIRRSRALARLARRAPGYSYARRTLLPRVRANTTVRGLAKRVFELDAAAGAIVDLAPGRLLGGIGTERLPVVAILALDVDERALGALVDEVARRQLMTAGFRPVIVSSTTDFVATQRYGFVTELLVDEESWPYPDRSWQDYVTDRVASVVARYQCSATVVAGRDGLDDTGRLILSALRPAS